MNVSGLFLMVFVRELLGVGGGGEHGCWWQRQAHACFLFALEICEGEATDFASVYGCTNIG